MNTAIAIETNRRGRYRAACRGRRFVDHAETDGAVPIAPCFAVITDCLRGAAQAFLRQNPLEDLTFRSCSGVAVLDEIFHSYCDWIEAEMLRDHIDLRFPRPGGFGAAEPAKRTAAHRIRINQSRRDFQVRNPVRPDTVLDCSVARRQALAIRAAVPEESD